MIGIYTIKNKINNKYYIGLSINIEQRFLFHQRRLRDNTHKNKHLQKSYNKYGIEGFEFIVIEECTEEQLCDKEKYYIKHYKSYKSELGYNKTYGGEFGKLTDEIVESTHKKLRGRKLSEDMKERIRKTLTGRKQPREDVEKRAKSNTLYNVEFLTEVFNYYLSNEVSRKEVYEKYNINKHTFCGYLKRYKIKKYGKEKTLLPWRHL